MKKTTKKILMGAVTAAFALSLLVKSASAQATGILNVNGENLWQESKTCLIGGTTYISLRALAEILLPAAHVTWRDGIAWVEGESLRIEAKPGEAYLKVNDRVFYAPHGVRNQSGSVLVPLRTLSEALGSEVSWSLEEGVTLTPGNGIPEAAPYREDEVYWLSRIISAESRGEPLEGKLAVGTVVMNRVASVEFPNTIYSVIFDREWGVQFQPVANGTVYDEPTEESVLAAKMVLEGARVAGDSLYFLAPELTSNHWIMENREFVTTIGVHWFYR